MVALASAFVRIRPQADKREFQKTGADMGGAAGGAAGKSFGDGYKRGADGKLRDSRGKFVKDSEAMGGSAGSSAGKGFSKSFKKDSGGAISALKDNLKLAAGVFVPLGLAGAVAQIGKIGIAYEDNLNIFKVVSNATGKQMDIVADKARKLGADVSLPGVSAAGAAEAMTELAKAGFTVQQSMDAAQATLQLARVANISEGQAAEIAANAVNAFGIEAKDTSKVVDQLAAAANSSSIEVTEASDAFKQAAAVFSGVQGPAVGGAEAITELNTAIAILGNNGIKGSDAGTSLKQTLLQLTGPSHTAKNAMIAIALAANDASGGMDKLLLPSKTKGGKIEQIDTGLTLMQAALTGTTKQSDAAINQLSALNPQLANVGDIAYDSSGKMRPLRDTIALLTAGLKDETQENRNAAIATIFGADASRSILALMKGGLPVWDAQRKAVMQSGAAAQFAAAKNAGLGGAIDNVKSQFENAAISIYNVAKGPLTESLNALAATLPKVFDVIGKFGSFIGANIGTIRDWAIAIGAVTLALKINSAMLAIQAAGGVLKAIQGISIITRATQAWAAAQVFLNATLLANPIGAVIIAVTALVAGIILLYRHNETFRKIVQAVWAAIKTAIKATVDWIVGTAWPAIQAAWKAIADAGLWLWHHVLEPVWDGIMKAVGIAVAYVKFQINIWIAVFKAVAAAATWFYENVLAPVFAGIRKVVEVWWLAVQIVFTAFYKVIKFVIGVVVDQLADTFGKAFGWIKDKVQLWWAGMKIIFDLFRQYVLGPIQDALAKAQAFFARIFGAISTVVSGWWRNNISPILGFVRNAWTQLAKSFTDVYTYKIKPLFELFVSLVRDKVVNGFKTGVDLITKAWEKVKEAARKPVAFVVNSVINPFIRGLNTAASVVGVKDRVSEIKGFRSGGKISGAGGMTDNRQAWIPGGGAVQLQGGEFVVNRENTGKALPLLRWVNAGMKGGAAAIARYLGKPLADMPGDGSEGWAFKDGGLVGWTKDIWSALSDPSSIKKPFEAMLTKIPGSGMIRDFLAGTAKRLLNGALSWLVGVDNSSITGTGVSAARAAKARAFVQEQAGKPYVWASAGPRGYDCSGIVSAAYNILKGGNPYNHTFSTSSLPGRWFDTSRKIGTLIAGWSHPGQSPASASVGHMAGQIAGMPFESTGSSGVRIGNRARKVGAFANVGVARASGGLIPDMIGHGIRLFDQGGYWPSGTLGANLSGRTEYVNPDGRAGGGSRTYYITQNIAPTAHPAEVGRQTILAIQAFERGNGSSWRKKA